MTGPATPSDNGKKPPAVARQMAGHELPFVTPSTYLHLPTRPLASAAASPAAVTAANPPHSRTVPLPEQPPVPPLPEKHPMTPLDKDQVQGLVSNCLCSETRSIPRSSYLVAAFLPLTAQPPPPHPSPFALTSCQSHVGEAFCLSRWPVVAARHAYACGVQLLSAVGVTSTRGPWHIYIYLHLPSFRPCRAARCIIRGEAVDDA